MAEDLWDDAAYRQRCLDLAERRGLSVRELASRSGTSRDYFERSLEGRNTNAIMRVAHVLEVSPVYLAFGVEDVK